MRSRLVAPNHNWIVDNLMLKTEVTQLVVFGIRAQVSGSGNCELETMESSTVILSQLKTQRQANVSELSAKSLAHHTLLSH